MARIQFLNTEVDNLTMQEALEEIGVLVEKRECSYVVTPNVDHIVQLEKNLVMQEIYRHASLILTDGMPLVWISKIKGCPIKEKVSGSDLLPRLCEFSTKKGYSMFFLGAAEGVAAKAAVNLQAQYEGLNICGTYSPDYGFEKNEEKIQQVIAIVKAAKPDILIVALGAPKQEKFIFEYRCELDVPVSLGLGASLDFAAGTIKRAPVWMANHGLEWVYRLIKEPRRLAKRYLVDDVAIFTLFFKYKVVNVVKEKESERIKELENSN